VSVAGQWVEGIRNGLKNSFKNML